MYFNPNYFKGETREDFYVAPMVKRAWAAQLEVLDMIAQICARHDIVWFAEYGTLLGAVRHGGFIPWDDDIDISMMRGDYERFLRIAPNELPEGWMLVNTRGAEGQNCAVGRVVNSTSIKTNPEFLSRFHGCPYVMGVDIFPYDNVPDDNDEFEQFSLLFNLVFNAIAIAKSTEKESGATLDNALSAIKEILNYDVTKDCDILEQLYSLGDYVAAMYADENTTRTVIVGELLIHDAFAIDKSAFSDIVFMPFEGFDLPVPIGYDRILRAYYGDDYMTPIQGTQLHDYPFGKDQQQMLFDVYTKQGQAIPDMFKE